MEKEYVKLFLGIDPLSINIDVSVSVSVSDYISATNSALVYIHLLLLLLLRHRKPICTVVVDSQKGHLADVEYVKL